MSKIQQTSHTEISQTEKKSNETKFTLENVAHIADLLAEKLDMAIGKVNQVTRETKILALNGAIQAASAGAHGKTFGVVASQMSELAEKTNQITTGMKNETRQEIVELAQVIKEQAKDFKGIRLSDLALTNIDLIDRNLYERTADIRWWATDRSVIEAITKNTEESCNFASHRLAIILKSYTVYHDLILCNLNGDIIASGKSDQFILTGKNCFEKPWFQCAIKTKNGTEFGFQAVHKSRIDGECPITFSCLVHEDGDTNKKPIGVLASVFNWNSLAQKIIDETPLNDDEKERSRICIVDDNGLVLADSDGKMLDATIEFEGRNQIFQEKKNYLLTNYEDLECCIGHALSPGYENYSSGWHSLIIQKLIDKK